MANLDSYEDIFARQNGDPCMCFFWCLDASTIAQSLQEVPREENGKTSVFKQIALLW